MNTSFVIVLATTVLAATSAQAMGSGHNPLRPATVARAAHLGDKPAGNAAGVRSRTLQQGGRTAQPVRVAALR
ncbi:MAG: hypothetical protein H7Z15_15875 [Rhizobacter sp.]|nr:hypothetical protein [Rhizobacter sp.]